MERPPVGENHTAMDTAARPLTVRRNPPRLARLQTPATDDARELPTEPRSRLAAVPFPIDEVPEIIPPPHSSKPSGIGKVSENLKVFLRIRALETKPRTGGKGEARNGTSRAHLALSKKIRKGRQEEKGKEKVCLVVNNVSSVTLEAPSPSTDAKRAKSEVYDGFSYVFPPDSAQNEVYEKVMGPLVKDFMNGKSGLLAAMGPTGSGKTYTMFGSPREPGMVPLALREIFCIDNMANHFSGGRSYLFSMFEIYCERGKGEKILDLSPDGVELSLQQSTVKGLQEIVISSVMEAESLIARGMLKRATAETNANSQSSRSQCIINIRHASKIMDKKKCVNNAVLTLVDLAGAERERKTGNQGARLIESNFINNTTMVFGLCLRSLLEHQKNPKRILQKHFQNSLLTRYLRDYLEGKKRFSLILTTKSGENDYNDTSYLLRHTAPLMTIKFHNIEELSNPRKRASELKMAVTHGPSKRRNCGSRDTSLVDEAKSREQILCSPNTSTRQQSSTSILESCNVACAETVDVPSKFCKRSEQVLLKFSKALWNTLKDYKQKLMASDKEIQKLKEVLDRKESQVIMLEKELKDLRSSCRLCDHSQKILSHPQDVCSEPSSDLASEPVCEKTITINTGEWKEDVTQGVIKDEAGVVCVVLKEEEIEVSTRKKEPEFLWHNDSSKRLCSNYMPSCQQAVNFPSYQDCVDSAKLSPREAHLSVAGSESAACNGCEAAADVSLDNVRCCESSKVEESAVLAYMKEANVLQPNDSLSGVLHTEVELECFQPTDSSDERISSHHGSCQWTSLSISQVHDLEDSSSTRAVCSPHSEISSGNVGNGSDSLKVKESPTLAVPFVKESDGFQHKNSSSGVLHIQKDLEGFQPIDSSAGQFSCFTSFCQHATLSQPDLNDIKHASFSPRAVCSPFSEVSEDDIGIGNSVLELQELEISTSEKEPEVCRHNDTCTGRCYHFMSFCQQAVKSPCHLERVGNATSSLNDTHNSLSDPAACFVCEPAEDVSSNKAGKRSASLTVEESAVLANAEEVDAFLPTDFSSRVLHIETEHDGIHPKDSSSGALHIETEVDGVQPNDSSSVLRIETELDSNQPGDSSAVNLSICASFCQKKSPSRNRLDNLGKASSNRHAACSSFSDVELASSSVIEQAKSADSETTNNGKVVSKDDEINDEVLEVQEMENFTVDKKPKFRWHNNTSPGRCSSFMSSCEEAANSPSHPDCMGKPTPSPFDTDNPLSDLETAAYTGCESAGDVSVDNVETVSGNLKVQESAVLTNVKEADALQPNDASSAVLLVETEFKGFPSDSSAGKFSSCTPLFKQATFSQSHVIDLEEASSDRHAVCSFSEVPEIDIGIYNEILEVQESKILTIEIEPEILQHNDTSTECGSHFMSSCPQAANSPSHPNCGGNHTSCPSDTYNPLSDSDSDASAGYESTKDVSPDNVGTGSASLEVQESAFLANVKEADALQPNDSSSGVLLIETQLEEFQPTVSPAGDFPSCTLLCQHATLSQSHLNDLEEASSRLHAVSSLYSEVELACSSEIEEAKIMVSDTLNSGKVVSSDDIHNPLSDSEPPECSGYEPAENVSADNVKMGSASLDVQESVVLANAKEADALQPNDSSSGVLHIETELEGFWPRNSSAGDFSSCTPLCQQATLSHSYFDDLEKASSKQQTVCSSYSEVELASCSEIEEAKNMNSETANGDKLVLNGLLTAETVVLPTQDLKQKLLQQESDIGPEAVKPKRKLLPSSAMLLKEVRGIDVDMEATSRKSDKLTEKKVYMSEKQKSQGSIALLRLLNSSRKH